MMKRVLFVVLLGCVAVASLVSADEKSGDPEVGTNRLPRQGGDIRKEAAPIYKTAKQIAAIPACKAVVTGSAPCYVYLKTDDGKGFYIGSPGNTMEVAHFRAFLKQGTTYRFPDVFFEFQKNFRAKDE